MSQDEKHAKVSIWMPEAMVAGLDALKELVSAAEDPVSRSAIVRVLLDLGAKKAMGDHSRTMRECVTDPTEEDVAREKSRRGRASRNKGLSFERLLVRRFNEAFPGIGAKRTLQSRGGASDGPDVDTPFWWVEAKRGKRPSIRAALNQAIEDSEGTGKIPLAIVKDDRQPATVTMLLDDWLEWEQEHYDESEI